MAAPGIGAAPGRTSRVGEDLGDHGGMFDGGDDLQGANRGLKPFHRRATANNAKRLRRSIR
jgi:hypothetical protein